MLGKGHGSPTPPRFGDYRKSGKIHCDPISIDCLLGDQDRVADYPGFADSLENRKVLLNSRRISVLKGAVCEALESATRSPRVVEARVSRWSTQDEGSPVISQKELGLSGRLGFRSMGWPLPRGSSVVVLRGSSRGRGVSRCSFAGPHVLVRGFRSVVADQLASGLWSEAEELLSINHRKLLAVERGFSKLRSILRGHVVVVFSDNTATVAYLRHQGGMLSPTLNEVAQRILRWTEREKISLLPQFVPGRNNMLADALSHPNQVVGTEWTLHQEVFDSLRKRWPVVIDLFASSLSRRCGVYFAPVSDPMATGTDAMLQSWDYLQGYAFPPFSMLPQVPRKLRSSKVAVITLITPLWPQRKWFPDFLELLLEPPLPLPERWDLLRQPHARLFHQRLGVLRLHVWRLSRDLCKPTDSLAEWLTNLALPGGLRL